MCKFITVILQEDIQNPKTQPGSYTHTVESRAHTASNQGMRRLIGGHPQLSQSRILQ